MKTETKIQQKLSRLDHDNKITKAMVVGIAADFANGKFSLDHASRMIRPHLSTMRTRVDQQKVLVEVVSQ